MEEFPKLKRHLWLGKLWARGHYVGTSGDKVTVCDKIEGDHLIKKSAIPIEINHQVPGVGDDQGGRKRANQKGIFQETKEHSGDRQRASSLVGGEDVTLRRWFLTTTLYIIY